MAFSSGEKVMALPAEWTDKVCSYLDAEDLLNLSAVNTFWRNAVNRNSIWKPLCVKYFNVHPSEKPIIDRKCRVEPAFEIVANSSNNLSDICSWRIRYAQEIHVMNNWIHNRYHEDTSDTFSPDSHGCLWQNSFFFYKRRHHYFGDENNDDFKFVNWNLTDDFKVRHFLIDRLFLFKNGFLVSNCFLIYYYALKEDEDFELKIRTLCSKALLSNVPLIADPSQFGVEIGVSLDIAFNIVSNERYLVLYQSGCQLPTLIVWDFESLTTFSVDRNFLKSLVGKKEYFLWLGERESSILFLQIRTYEYSQKGRFYFIFDIKSSTIALLHKHRFYDDSFAEIVDDNLAVMGSDQLIILDSDGGIRTVNCPNATQLINCRSFYCALTEQLINHKLSYEVVLINKEDFSVQVIKRYKDEELTFESLLKYSSLDLFLVKNWDTLKVELYDLKKFKIIELDSNFDIRAFNHNNKIVLTETSYHGRKVSHFW